MSFPDAEAETNICQNIHEIQPGSVVGSRSIIILCLVKYYIFWHEFISIFQTHVHDEAEGRVSTVYYLDCDLEINYTNKWTLFSFSRWFKIYIVCPVQTKLPKTQLKIPIPRSPLSSFGGPEPFLPGDLCPLAGRGPILPPPWEDESPGFLPLSALWPAGLGHYLFGRASLGLEAMIGGPSAWLDNDLDFN